MTTLPGLGTTVYDRTVVYNQLLSLLLGGMTRGGFQSNYGYDANGRLNNVDITGLLRANAAITYNVSGRVTQVVISIEKTLPDFPEDRVVTVDYTYDANGYILSAIQTEVP